MPRQARIVLPGYPHHVVQRGNRRQQTFFEDGDYAHYRDLMAAACARFNVRCWAWCLMPNHVHLVLEPSDETGLAKAVAQAHQRYTRHINAREGWTGFLWQGRFSSCAMDEAHALMAVRYVELNPVKARLCPRAQDWAWSSAGYHHGGPPDGLTADAAYLSRIADWGRYLEDALTLEEEARLGFSPRRDTRWARPAGWRIWRRSRPGASRHAGVAARVRGRINWCVSLFFLVCVPVFPWRQVKGCVSLFSGNVNIINININ